MHTISPLAARLSHDGALGSSHTAPPPLSPSPPSRAARSRTALVYRRFYFGASAAIVIGVAGGDGVLGASGAHRADTSRERGVNVREVLRVLGSELVDLRQLKGTRLSRTHVPCPRRT